MILETAVFNWSNFTDYQQALIGGGVGAFIATFLIFFIFILAAFYVYHSLAWMRIAKKLKHKKPWLAWIPFANSAMRLQLGGFHWAWVFLALLPFFGWIPLIVLLTISTWRIFEKRKFPEWLGLSFAVMFVPKIAGIGFIAYMVCIGIVAWKKK